MRFRAFLILGVVATSLFGCMDSRVHVFDKVDRTDKSITVPPGASPLLSEIKTALSRDGWRMIVDRGPRTTKGTMDRSVQLETADTFHTRYRLQLAENQFDYCITGGEAIYYNLAVVDNKSGAEVIAMGGRDCVPNVGSKFAAALKAK